MLSTRQSLVRVLAPLMIALALVAVPAAAEAGHGHKHRHAKVHPGVTHESFCAARPGTRHCRFHPKHSHAEYRASAAHRAERRAARVIAVARAQAGDPYRYGASGPGAFDCSGLTSYVYKRAAGIRLPHSSSAQRDRAKRISRGAARRGDLVFFHNGGGVYHVGIYAGKNQIWHSPYSGRSVTKERIWTSSVSFGRVRG